MFLDTNFWTKLFWTQQFVGPNICLDPTYFWTQHIFGPNIWFRNQHFSGPNIFLDSTFFGLKFCFTQFFGAPLFLGELKESLSVALLSPACFP